MCLTLVPRLLLLFLFPANWTNSNAAKILFFWGMGGYSHRITVWPLVEKLASKGHQITFFSPHQAKGNVISNPNIIDISPPDLYTRIGMDYDPAEIRFSGGVKAVERLWPSYLESGIQLCEVFTTDKKIGEWANQVTFDLIVINGLFNDCAFALAYKQNAPTIIYGTSGLFPWWSETYGLPDENYPEFHFHLPENMTFSQQLWNTFTPLFWKMYREWYYLPKIEAISKAAYNLPEMPSIAELEKRNSLILANTHYSEEYPRSLPPWIVPVGGMHCHDKRNPLPEGILKFISKWEKGFIYFSFGTYMRLPLLPNRIKEAIFAAIKNFPEIGFIMKWNGGPVPDDIPSNVLTAEWLAQQDILAHHKVIAFISHGGLLSTQEAVYHSVPIIVFPIFAEQDYNAQRIHSKERGIMMEISDLTADKMKRAIHEIITNRKYKDNMIQVSKVFRDRPEHPADTASWWVEFTLRHRNTTFLKPIGISRTWYERRMLHVWGFLIIIALIVYIILCKLRRMLFFCRITGKLKRL